MCDCLLERRNETRRKESIYILLENGFVYVCDREVWVLVCLLQELREVNVLGV